MKNILRSTFSHIRLKIGAKTRNPTELLHVRRAKVPCHIRSSSHMKHSGDKYCLKMIAQLEFTILFYILFGCVAWYSHAAYVYF